MASTPMWLVGLLIRELPAQDAAAQLASVMAALSPHMEDRDRRAMIERLVALVSPPPEVPPIEIIEHDPAKAAEWFRSQGFLVVESA